MIYLLPFLFSLTLFLRIPQVKPYNCHSDDFKIVICSLGLCQNARKFNILPKYLSLSHCGSITADHLALMILSTSLPCCVCCWLIHMTRLSCDKVMWFDHVCSRLWEMMWICKKKRMKNWEWLNARLRNQTLTMSDCEIRNFCKKMFNKDHCVAIWQIFSAQLFRNNLIQVWCYHTCS